MKLKNVQKSNSNNVKFINFLPDKLIVVFDNNLTTSYQYDNLKMHLDIGVYRRYTIGLLKNLDIFLNDSIRDLHIKIKDNKHNTIELDVDVLWNISRFFKIFYYSKFVKKISYKIKSNYKKDKQSLSREINNFVNNNYKLTKKIILTMIIEWFTILSIILSCAFLILYSFYER